MATATKTSLKKWICVLSIFITITPTHLLCQMQANSFWAKFLRTIFKVRKRRKISRRLFTSSIKREIRHVPVVVEQGRQKKCTKKARCTCSVQCFFSLFNLLLFWPSHCRRRRGVPNLPIATLETRGNLCELFFAGSFGTVTKYMEKKIVQELTGASPGTIPITIAGYISASGPSLFLKWRIWFTLWIFIVKLAVSFSVFCLQRCKVCRSKAVGKTLILCDECNLGYHLQCLRPALSEVPEGHWSCPICKVASLSLVRRFRSFWAFRPAH